MKIKSITSLCLISIALVFTGCGSTTQPTTQHEIKTDMIQTANNLPDWIMNPEYTNAIAAVGITGYSKHGMQVMLPQTEMDGRAKLAGKIKTTISQLKAKVLRHSKINTLDDFDNTFKEVTKEVIKDMPISGARRVKMHQAKDGTLYVLMIIEKREVSSHLKEIKTAYKKAELSRKNLDAGMSIIDSMIKELDSNN